MSFFSVGTKEFYDRIAFIYPISCIYFSRYKKIVENLIEREDEVKNILDIGGLLSKTFLDRTHHYTTGIDFSEKMIRKTKDSYSDFYLKDVHVVDRLNLPVHYDFIVLGFVASVLDNRAALFGKLANILKNNGCIIVLNHFVDMQARRKIPKWLNLMVFLSRKLHFKYNFSIEDCGLPCSLYIQTIKNLNVRGDIKCLMIKKTDV